MTKVVFYEEYSGAVSDQTLGSVPTNKTGYITLVEVTNEDTSNKLKIKITDNFTDASGSSVSKTVLRWIVDTESTSVYEYKTKPKPVLGTLKVTTEGVTGTVCVLVSVEIED